MKRTEDFRISEIVWHELAQRSGYFTEYLANLLNQNFSLKNYGNGLDYIYFVYIIDFDTIQEEYFSYSKKYKKITIRHKLDYEKFIQVSENENLLEMIAVFLAKVKEFEKWKIQDFDSKRFYEDLEAFFLRENWIESIDNILK